MKKLSRFLLKALALNVVALGAGLASAQTVTLSTLLDEMTNRDAITLAPNYTVKQASSYDRASKSPEENWFANADTSQFIRVEQNGDREESVLMETEGPGAIVRWWITAPHYKNNIYVYIDGATEPTICCKIDELVGGGLLAAAPLSEENARGRNLYLPIPYAKSIKVTCDNMKEQGNLYYQINYRTYEEGVEVESFTQDGLSALKEKIDATNKSLLEPGKTAQPQQSQGYTRRIESEMMEGLFEAFRIQGPGCITEISVKLDAEDIVNAVRNVAICISFDGEETVWCPVGDFFGSGVGVNPYKSWYTEVFEDGTMKAYWRMPYKEEARVSFVNYGNEDVSVDYSVYYTKKPWTEDSMYFHANWRQEREIETVAGNGTMDWNYTALKGTGVFVGDVLSVVNSTSAWWGEGDEKIYVDGEDFPSHFGTGTEDYYGYAWCTPEFFQAPFHAQPRAQGPGNFGNTTNLRFRSLDGIPFKSDFRFDMEIWHWEVATVDYAVATFWYGLPGATINEDLGPDRDELEDEACEPVDYDKKMVLKFDNFEASEVTGGQIATQGMKTFVKEGKEAWKNDKQLWWTNGKDGDALTINVKDVPKGKTKLVLGVTVAKDYCCAQFSWNGAEVGKGLDFYYPEVEHRVVKIGIPETSGEDGVLEVKIIGKNKNSIGSLFGVDSIGWE